MAGLAGYRTRVYLFGSRARGRAGRTSDIDIGILPLEPVPLEVWSRLREALEDSHVLYPVDLVDLSRVPAEFRQRVEGEAIAWGESTNV